MGPMLHKIPYFYLSLHQYPAFCISLHRDSNLKLWISDEQGSAEWRTNPWDVVVVEHRMGPVRACHPQSAHAIRTGEDVRVASLLSRCRCRAGRRGRVAIAQVCTRFPHARISRDSAEGGDNESGGLP